MFSWNCVVGGETLEVLNDFKEVTLELFACFLYNTCFNAHFEVRYCFSTRVPTAQLPGIRWWLLLYSSSAFDGSIVGLPQHYHGLTRYGHGPESGFWMCVWLFSNTTSSWKQETPSRNGIPPIVGQSAASLPIEVDEEKRGLMLMARNAER